MTELGFTVEGIAPEPYAVTPVLMARIGISADGPEPIHAVALRCSGPDRSVAAQLYRR